MGSEMAAEQARSFSKNGRPWFSDWASRTIVRLEKYLPGFLGVLFLAMVGGMTNLLSAAVYDYLTDQTHVFRVGGLSFTWLGFVALMFVAEILIALVGSYPAKLLWSRILAEVHSSRLTIRFDKNEAPKSQALVLFAATGPKKADETAIKHHLGRLKCCEIIYTPTSEKWANQLKSDRLYAGVEINLTPLKDENSAIEAQQTVQTAIARVLKAFSKKEVFVDITAGTKPMTVGAVLASLVSEVGMQYVLVARNPEGDVASTKAEDSRVITVEVDTGRWFSPQLEGSGASGSAVSES